MEIVYTNRRDGEKRVHIEVDAAEAASLADGSSGQVARLHSLIAEADHRLNPGRPGRAAERGGGPHCGNNPNAPLTDGDRQVIAEFRAYLKHRATEYGAHPK